MESDYELICEDREMIGEKIRGGEEEVERDKGF